MDLKCIIRKPWRPIIRAWYRIQKRIRAKKTAAQLRSNKNKWYEQLDSFAAEVVASGSYPQLTPEDCLAIDQYWGQYGIHFQNYNWFQMYYHTTGKKDPRFIPHGVLACAVYPYYNDLSKAKVWADKNEFSRILPGIRFPATIGQRIHGKYYDSNRICYGSIPGDDYIESIYAAITQKKLDSIILKKTTNTNSGKGVKKYSITCKDDLKTVLSEQCSIDFIIQEPVLQHAFLSQFNKSSVNIIRLTTWRSERDVFAFSPCVRFGVEGSVTDIAFVNGKEIINAVAINENGEISDHYYTLYGERVPLDAKQKTVPHWCEILEVVKTGHLSLDYFDVVAWDITLDRDGNVICVEYNIQEPASIVYQFCQGPFAAGYTDSFLSFLKNKDNQTAYLPACLIL